MLRSTRSLSVLVVLAALGCHYFPNHFLGHPTSTPAGVVTWVDEVTSDGFRVHVRGARPPGDGPFPTIVVLPEAGKTAEDMEPLAWDLATSGYLAVGAHYERRTNGEYQTQLFPWRSPADIDAIFPLLARYPEVDPRRIGLLGFSQGGVLALLIAAHAPDRVRAVVSYYPVTDFPAWLDKENGSLWQRFSFFFVRSYFRSESGARSDAEYARLLEAASPYFVAAAIEAPVLLVHGDEDTTAPIEESRRMADRLAELGKPVRLLAIPGGVHIFNFRQPEAEQVAWRATLEWFDTYLQPTPTAAGRPVPQASREVGP